MPRSLKELEEFKVDWMTEPEIPIDQYTGFEDFPEHHAELRQFEKDYRARVARETLERDHFASIIGDPDPSYDYTPIMDEIQEATDVHDLFIDPDFGDHRSINLELDRYPHADLLVEKIVGVLVRHPEITIVRSGRIDNNGENAHPSYRVYGVIFYATITQEAALRGTRFRLEWQWLIGEPPADMLMVATLERDVSKLINDGWKFRSAQQSADESHEGVHLISVTLTKDGTSS